MMAVVLLQSEIQKALYTYTAPFKNVYRNNFQKHEKKHLLRANHIVTTVPGSLPLILLSDMKTEYLQLKIPVTHYFNIRVNLTQPNELTLTASLTTFMNLFAFAIDHFISILNISQ